MFGSIMAVVSKEVEDRHTRAAPVHNAIARRNANTLREALGVYLQNTKNKEERALPLFWLAVKTLKMEKNCALLMWDAALGFGLDPNAREPGRMDGQRMPLSYLISVQPPVPKRSQSDEQSPSVQLLRSSVDRPPPQVVAHPSVIRRLMIAGAKPFEAPLGHVNCDLSDWNLGHLKTVGQLLAHMKGSQ